MGTARQAPIPFHLPDDLSGSKVGRFLIRSKLGAGGMGEVWYAEDTALRRPVALKRLNRALANDADARRRILAEAQRACALGSDRVAGIHDVLEDRGEVFVVMEYVEGETLRRRLHRGFSLEQFLDIAVQCVEALVAAHEHGIVHCDIKPENIMLTAEGHVKVLDFGLAKHLPRSDQSTTLERTGLLAGTAGYIAPEVLLEKVPDCRADIFSLGVVFYEMLTLRHPFAAGSFVEISERVLHKTPTPIPVFNPAVPAQLAAIVFRMLAKSAENRFSDGRELLKTLHAIKAVGVVAEGTVALPATTHRRARLLKLAAFALVFVGAVLAGYRRLHTSPLLPARGWVLVSDFDVSGDQPVPDNGVREGLTISMQQSHYVNVFPRSRAFEVLKRMKKGDARRIDETLGREICERENLQLLLTGSISRLGQAFQISVRAMDPAQGSVLFAETERFTKEDQFFDRADVLVSKVRKHLGESLEGIEKSSRPLARVTTGSLAALHQYSLARDAADQGKNEQAEILLRDALRLDPDFAMAHLLLGQYYLAGVGKNKTAVEELQHAFELREGVTEREKYRIEAAYYGLQERYDDEVRSLSLLTELYADDEDAHQALAGAYFDVGKFDEAIAELRQVLRLNASSAPAYSNLVLQLARQNQTDAALATAREARVRGIESARLYWGVGLAYLGQGKTAEAQEQFRQMMSGNETDRALGHLYLAVVELYEGRLDSAGAHLSRSRASPATFSNGLQTIWHNLLGRIYLSQDKWAEAKKEANLILALPNSLVQAYDLLNSGTIYARSGNIKQARAILRRLDVAGVSATSAWNQSCFHNLEGEIWLATGKLQRAEQSFVTASQEYPQAFSHLGLAHAYQSQQRWEQSIAEWEQVLERRGEILQHEFPPDIADAHLQLARLYRKQGKMDLARNHYGELVRIWQNTDQAALLTKAKRELRGLDLELARK
ncbi:MAG TPA: protein kinase [Terriglobales bacterium]|nr:protein kinase [Terriglobales bacterium]